MSANNENHILSNPFPRRSELDELMSMFKAFDLLESLGDPKEQIIIPFPTHNRYSSSTQQAARKVA